MKYRLGLIGLGLILILVGCSSTKGTVDTSTNNSDSVQVFADCLALNASGREMLAARSLIFNVYDISAALSPETGEVRGQVSITLERSYPGQKVLFLNLYPNIYRDNGGGIYIDEVLVAGKKVDFRVSGTQLEVLVPEGVCPGETLSLSFVVQLPRLEGRFGDDGQTVLLAHWLPTLACFENGQWHLPQPSQVGDPYFNEAAVYQAEISLPREYQLASTGWQEEKIHGSQRVVLVETGPVRDFTCVISDSFNLWHRYTRAGVELRLYTPEMLDTAQAAALLSLLEEGLQFLSDAVGSYPYSQLSVTTHHLGLLSGMEYANLIVLDPDLITHQLTQRAKHVLVHELVHQWFYGVVGNNQYAEAWIDESLAEYLSDVFFMRGLEPDERRRAIWQKALDLRHAPLEAPLQKIDEFASRKTYYNSVYRKSALMFHALEQWLGWDTIQEVLAGFYEQWAFGVATTQAFVEWAEKITDLRLAAFINSWLHRVEIPALTASSAANPLQLPEELLTQIYRQNAEDWCRRWAQAVISGDEEVLMKLAGRTLQQVLPLAAGTVVAGFDGYSFNISLGAGYQAADVFFYTDLTDSSGKRKEALLWHRIRLEQTSTTIVATEFEAQLSISNDSLPGLLAERFGRIAYYLRQQDGALVLPLVHPEKRDSIASAIIRDFNWDRPEWQEIVLGQNREIDAAQRILSYQLKVLYTKDHTSEIVLLTWQFKVERFDGKWYIVDYQYLEH